MTVLCRYDTRAHPIKDANAQIVPHGKNLYNPRVEGQADVDEPHDDLFDRTKLPRMPWHDITFCVSGAAAKDAAMHFLQRWDNHEKSQKFSSSRQGLDPSARGTRDYDGDPCNDHADSLCHHSR